MNREELINKCEKAAHEMRIDAIKAAYSTGKTGAHIGGTLSMIEIMAVLYLAVLRMNPGNLRDESRDRFILSKGHGMLAQYTAMKQLGIIDEHELSSYKKNETRLFVHPFRNQDLGIEFSSGSLGMGISLGVGVALALKKKGNPARIYVLVGDGECAEGNVWEALLSVAHYQLDNLMVIVDRNHLQVEGTTEEILSLASLRDKFESFGFDVDEVDGHSVPELIDVFSKSSAGPRAVIADTIKGKGVSFMEGNPIWHDRGMTDSQYELAMKEQGAAI